VSTVLQKFSHSNQPVQTPNTFNIKTSPKAPMSLSQLTQLFLKLKSTLTHNSPPNVNPKTKLIALKEK
jgi:hypothetical protein